MRSLPLFFLFLCPAFLSAGMKEAVTAFEKHDFKGAYGLFIKETLSDNPAAYYYLAQMNEKGLGLEVDEKKAVELYDKAAALEEPNSLYLIGLAYLSGLYGKTRDTGKGVSLIKKADKKGNQDATIKLGEIYHKGFASVLPDLSLALKYFKKIHKENPKAGYYLGLMTMNGGGVGKNVKKGFNLVYKSAMDGYGPAQIETGRIYLEGRGMEKNHEAAVKWFEKAGRERIEEAAFYIALAYSDGDFSGRDELKAYSWHLVAARYGNGQSEGLLDLDRKNFSEKQLQEAAEMAEKNIREIFEDR